MVWTGTREVQAAVGEGDRGMGEGHPTPAGLRSWALSRGTVVQDRVRGGTECDRSCAWDASLGSELEEAG